MATPVGIIEGLLPHRMPFRFVDEMLTVEAERGVFALDLAVDDERLREGHLAPLYLVEALAQSAAAYHGALLQNADGEREEGMLVQLDRVKMHGMAHAGERITLHIERTHGLGAMVRFRGSAKCGGTTLVEAELTVARGAPEV